MKILIYALILILCFFEVSLIRSGLRKEELLNQKIAAARTEIGKAQIQVEELQSEIHTLSETLKNHIVPSSDTLEWCHGWLNDTIGSLGTPFDTEYLGFRTPFKLKIPKELRDAGSYRNIVLTAYELKIQTTAPLQKIYELAEAIESPAYPAIVNALSIRPTGSSDYEMDIHILLPSFLYDDEFMITSQTLEYLPERTSDS